MQPIAPQLAVRQALTACVAPVDLTVARSARTRWGDSIIPRRTNTTANNSSPAPRGTSRMARFGSPPCSQSPPTKKPAGINDQRRKHGNGCARHPDRPSDLRIRPGKAPGSGSKTACRARGPASTAAAEARSADRGRSPTSIRETPPRRFPGSGRPPSPSQPAIRCRRTSRAVRSKASPVLRSICNSFPFAVPSRGTRRRTGRARGHSLMVTGRSFRCR